MSGAGSIKGDGSDEHNHYEIKDANKSYTLTGADMKKHYMESIHELKEAVMIIQFANGLTACITIVPSDSIGMYGDNK